MTLTKLHMQQYRTAVMAIMVAVLALIAAPASAAAHDGSDHGSDPIVSAVAVTITAADTVPAGLSGRILIDAQRDGEAWYVNPQTGRRTYLGRPAAALDRLVARGTAVQFSAIAQLPETEGGVHDAEHGAAMAGRILTPEDLVGASWYVHPVTHVRMRLATPDDAWKVLQTGVPVPSAAIDAIAIEAQPETRFGMARAFVGMETADTLVFADGSKVRIDSVEIPANPDLQAAAKELIASRLAAGSVLLEKDVRKEAADGTPLRHVVAAGVNLSHDLVRNGLAFPAIAHPNYRHAEQLIVASIDARRLGLGFWSPAWQATGMLN